MFDDLLDATVIFRWLKSHTEEEAQKAKDALQLAIKATLKAKSLTTVRYFFPDEFGTWRRETHAIEIEFLAECWRYGSELESYVKKKS